jgi:protein-L-isoaspartate(D-aspartate) O-methyltransferase
MVDEQIVKRGISNKAVIQAMRTVPRHLFVPDDMQDMAYEDHPLQIGEGQTISQPYIVAYMTEKLHLKPDDKVLEIGTGSGYQAAVLANIVNSVFSVEIIPELALTAVENLKKADITNVMVKQGDGYYGWKEHAPYNAIIITAAAGTIPQPLIDQLAENGRLIAPVGNEHYTQYLKLYSRKKGKVTSATLLPVRFVPFTRDEEP